MHIRTHTHTTRCRLADDVAAQLDVLEQHLQLPAEGEQGVAAMCSPSRGAAAMLEVGGCVCVCVHVCVRACVRAYVRACVSVCVLGPWHREGQD